MVAEMSEAYLFPTSSVPATSRFPFRSPLTFLEDSRFDQELLAAEKAWASRKSVEGSNHKSPFVCGCCTTKTKIYDYISGKNYQNA